METNAAIFLKSKSLVLSAEGSERSISWSAVASSGVGFGGDVNDGACQKKRSREYCASAVECNKDVR